MKNQEHDCIPIFPFLCLPVNYGGLQVQTESFFFGLFNNANIHTEFKILSGGLDCPHQPSQSCQLTGIKNAATCIFLDKSERKKNKTFLVLWTYTLFYVKCIYVSWLRGHIRNHRGPSHESSWKTNQSPWRGKRRSYSRALDVTGKWKKKTDHFHQEKNRGTSHDKDSLGLS